MLARLKSLEGVEAKYEACQASIEKLQKRVQQIYRNYKKAYEGKIKWKDAYKMVLGELQHELDEDEGFNEVKSI